MALVRPEDFRANKICILNPTFGAGSGLVHAADADLLIDGTLTDLKTNKHLLLDPQYSTSSSATTCFHRSEVYLSARKPGLTFWVFISRVSASLIKKK